MTHTTDTTVISATRLMDLAREVVLQLGEWQHHPALTINIWNALGGRRPHINLSLVGREVSHADHAAYLDSLAIALGVVTRVDKNWNASVDQFDYRGTGVSVAGTGEIEGAR